MQANEPTTTLQQALFGPQPKCVLYYMSDPEQGRPSKKFYMLPQALNTKKPWLYLLYPKGTAPAKTPHLCLLMGHIEATFLQLVEPLGDYTPIAPGSDRMEFTRVNSLPFLNRLRSRCRVRIPVSASAQSIAAYAMAVLQCPSILKVGKTDKQRYHSLALDCGCETAH